MLGESDGTKGDATIEQIGRRRTFTRTLQLAVILAVVQWPMRDAVHDTTGPVFNCEVPGRLSLLVDALFIMAYVYAAYRAYKYVKFLNRQSWKQVAAIGSWIVFVAAVLDVIEDIQLWTELDGSCADLSTGWFTWLMRGTGLAGALIVAVAYFASSRLGQRLLYGVRLDPPATFKRIKDDGKDADW
jgi:hypothetical protein